MTITATKFQTLHSNTTHSLIFSESYSSSISVVQLPSQSALYQWVNANSGTVVSGASALSLWQDISGHGHDYHPFDTTATHMPTLKATSSFNNQPAVCITGSGLGLISNWPSSLTGSGITIGAIYRRTGDDDAAGTLFASKKAGGIAYQTSASQLHNVFPGGQQNTIYAAGPAGTAGGSNFYTFNVPAPGITYWAVWRIDKAQLDVWITSSLDSTQPMTATESMDSDVFFIGGRTNPGDSWETNKLMDVLEVIVYQGALTDTDVLSLNSYLSSSSTAFTTTSLQQFTSSFTSALDRTQVDSIMSLDFGKLGFERFQNISGTLTASLMGAPSGTSPTFWVPVNTPSGAGFIPIWR